MALGFAGRLFANQVRASAGPAGIAGVAGGLAFNWLLRRSPMGAVALGAVMLGRQAYATRKSAQARRDAKLALQKGALAVPPVVNGAQAERRED